MLFKKFFTLIMIGAGLSGGGAWACGDIGCVPNWILNQKEYDHCNNLPILTPSNDTKVNLTLLLVDGGFGTLQETPAEELENGYGKVPFEIYPPLYKGIAENKGNQSFRSEFEEIQGNPGQGSRCVSNVTGGAEFIDAVSREENLPAHERQILIEERQRLNPICVDAEDASVASFNVNTQNISSQTGMQFLQYLSAASAFYEGRYDEASSIFAGLMDSSQAWLKEASWYMAGRTELNRAQQHAFDGYGFPDSDKVDMKGMLSAEEKFNKYLLKYPSGRYAASAKGLLRRVYWLTKQPDKLAAEFSWQMHNQHSPKHNLSLNNLVLEADNKLLTTASPEQITDPVQLAVIDLLLMRSAQPADEQDEQSNSAALQKQETLFTNHKKLYQYLLAAHSFYVLKNPAAALKILPDNIPAKMSYLDFSRLVLRGLALEATKDHLDAHKLWLNLLPAANQPLQNETVQLALALNYGKSKETEKFFAEESPMITDQAVRNRLICHIASASLLRKIIAKSNSAQERDTALHTLLYKDILTGNYADYMQDIHLLNADALNHNTPTDDLPGLDHDDNVLLALFNWSGNESDDSISCPSITDIIKKLAKNQKDNYSLLCLGDFINANDLDSVLNNELDQRPSGSNTLGATSAFLGKIFSRSEAYKTIIADNKAASELKAYALYRAIKCYANTGTNHCGGVDVDVSVRKSWFRMLKKHYKNSIWAKRLKYYW